MDTEQQDRLITRLHALADAVAKRKFDEFTMRVPAEPERDADLVLSRAAKELERLRSRVAELEAAQSADLEIAIGMLADWCVCVSDNGTGWDDWDECYKDAAYREGPLRDRIDLAMANIRALRTHR